MLILHDHYDHIFFLSGPIWSAWFDWWIWWGWWLWCRKCKICKLRRALIITKNYNSAMKNLARYQGFLNKYFVKVYYITFFKYNQFVSKFPACNCILKLVVAQTYIIDQNAPPQSTQVMWRILERFLTWFIQGK